MNENDHAQMNNSVSTESQLPSQEVSQIETPPTPPVASVGINEEQQSISQNNNPTTISLADTLAVTSTHINDENHVVHKILLGPPNTRWRVRQHTWRRIRYKRNKIERPVAMRVFLLCILLIGILTPMLGSLLVGVRAYMVYVDLKNHANSGINHLKNIPAIISPKDKAGATTKHALDATSLIQVRGELQAAHNDFQQAHEIIANTNMLQIAAQLYPRANTSLTSADSASLMAVDVTNIGLEFINLGQTIAPRFHGANLFSTNQTPLLTQEDMPTIKATFARTMPIIQDMELRARTISVDDLPVNEKQKGQLKEVLQILPQFTTFLKTSSSLVDTLGWLLGVDQPRTILVQSMDRAELRASGGFTGQYGELHLHGGRVEPFTLKNIALLEYAPEVRSKNATTLAPTSYPWWPFNNWGLRDSNLSANFPTSANYAIERYNAETSTRVDGVIAFTPELIKHIISAVGSITVPRYNETITAQNLEAKLHFYQLSHDGIVKQKQVENMPNADDNAVRKLFTATLTKALTDRVSHLSAQEIIPVARQVIDDMKTRDLQVYFTNPQAEDILKKYGLAGEMDHSTNKDSLYIVQANVSVNKATEYMKTTFSDTVTLDKKGGATHKLQMNLFYDKGSNDVYGIDTYRDYVRVYVPANAQFIDGNGYEQKNHPICGGAGLGACPDEHVYPHDEITCPPGQYYIGATEYYLDKIDPYNPGDAHPLMAVGKPDNFTSDEPGRAMFGGYFVIPKNCTLSATLSWYVPDVVHNSSYQLLYQRQAGTEIQTRINIIPASCPQPALTSNQQITRDMLYTLKAQPEGDNCQPGTNVGPKL